MSGTFKMPTRELAASAAFITLIAALGVMVKLQGWRSRVPFIDVIGPIDSAHVLLTEGWLPDRGTVTSLASYAPPGTSWLFVPGIALFSDPRLFEFPGSVMLHIGTLTGIFLLARAYFGVRCALLSVAVYGLSTRGLFFVGSLEPRGHPFFFIWMVYLACLWVTRRQARYLAAAVLTWAAGMYVFMEIAPAVFILPVVWFFYRPPARVRAMAVAGSLAFLMWYPYLRFETTRHFADLRSQLLLQSLQPAKYWEAWCDSTLALGIGGRPSMEGMVSGRRDPESVTSRFVLALGRRGLAIVRGLVSNFEGPVPGMELVLLGLVAGGLLLLAFPERQIPTGDFKAGGASFRPQVVAVFGTILLASSVLANESIITRFAPNDALASYTISSIRTFQLMAALGGIALLMRGPIAKALQTLAIRLQPVQGDTRPLVFSLTTPWLILLLAAEHGRPERFFWLWPVQVLVLTVYFTNVRPPLHMGQRICKLAAILAICTVVDTGLVPSINGVLKREWSGSDATQVQVAGYVADLLRQSGRARASIGYQLFTENWTPRFAAVDSRYKVGAAVDLFFKYLHGVSNENECAEGAAPDDEYRIVQSGNLGDGPEQYFLFPSRGGFHLLRQFENYNVYKRD